MPELMDGYLTLHTDGTATATFAGHRYVECVSEAEARRVLTDLADGRPMWLFREGQTYEPLLRSEEHGATPKNPISKIDYEREIDAAHGGEDPDLFDFDYNTGHPADFDPLGDGLTLGKAREQLKATIAKSRAEKK